MEFSIDIHTTLEGDLIVEDFSKEYGQYIDEDVEVIASYDDYKYSESASLNVVIKVDMDKVTLMDVLLDKHEEDIDSVSFKIHKDGYYTVDHIILPNIKWWENSSADNKRYYDTIYVTDGEKVYKAVDGELQECTVREILERNIEGTTIKKCKVDVFFTAHLQNCYIDWCKQIFNNLLNTCNRDKYDQAIYSRDFVWMALNIIDYLVGFKQYMEAERILEMFNGCGGFCRNRDIKHHNGGCGCSKG